MRRRVRFLLAMLFFGMVAEGQQETRPQFDVAAIKESKTGAHNGGGYSSPGGRYRAENLPLHFLISSAYNVKTFQVTGGPGWVESVAWDIEAKGPGNPSPEQMRLMLQSLLEDRFKLQVRHRMTDHSVYLLGAAKSGAKLTPVDCSPDGVSCDNWSANSDDIKGDGITMQEFAGALSEALDVPVIDRSSMGGRFNIHLHWTPQNDDAVDTGSSTIFTAIQEQLGLRLESGKAPIDTLVIEHVEKPGEN